MNSTDGLKSSWGGHVFRFAAVMVIIGVLTVPLTIAEVQEPGYYKMVSTVEYDGPGQYRNQFESFVTVQKNQFLDNRVKYSISSKDLNFAKDTGGNQELSFVVDRNTSRLSGITKGYEFWQKAANYCVKSLDKVTKDNVGKTWKHSVSMSGLEDVLDTKLTFTLTAIEVEKQGIGKMIAVRAMSEPFFVKVKDGKVASKINSVYLFDSAVDEVYLSISVFNAATNTSGSVETLRHEVATYKTNAKGNPLQLDKLGADFEKLIGKVGLSSKPLEVTKACNLPKWATSDALRGAQIANICAATVCEGAQNPVATVSIPVAKAVEMQSGVKWPLKSTDSQFAAKEVGPTPEPNIFQQISQNWGWNLPTAAVVGGVTVGAVAIGGGFDSDGGSNDVASP